MTELTSLQIYNYFSSFHNGQVHSPDFSETPKITEMTENFTKVTKYITKFKETLINSVWEKSHVKKAVTIKFSVDSALSNMFYGNKRKPGKAGNEKKAFEIKKNTQC